MLFSEDSFFFIDISAIGLTPYHGETSKRVIYLSFLGVSPLHRNLGLGKKLLEAAISCARKNQYDSIRLTTLPGVLNSVCNSYLSFVLPNRIANIYDFCYKLIFIIRPIIYMKNMALLRYRGKLLKFI